MDDGLDMRPSHGNALLKFAAVRRYIEISNTAMQGKWIRRNYVDLQAGPGKNRIGRRIVFGTPLIALTANFPATGFYFNELDKSNFDALSKRVNASDLKNTTHLFNDDANDIVTTVCRDLERQSGLNIAFVDPEGLEIEWSTIERLARVKRMDLIINFSTSGIRRAEGAGYYEVIDAFLGRMNGDQYGGLHRVKFGCRIWFSFTGNAWLYWLPNNYQKCWRVFKLYFSQNLT